MPAESVHTAITLHAVGQELHRQSKHAQALKHSRRALTGQREALDDRHPHTTSTLSAIGQILHAQSDLSAALEHHRKALAIKRGA